MRYRDIKDERILEEKEQLLDSYMKDAPEGTNICDWIETHASEYYINFMKKYYPEENQLDE